MVRLVIGFFRAFLAAASALSLPGMLTWLGIQKRIFFLPDVLRASYLRKIWRIKGLVHFMFRIARRTKFESEKMT